MTPLKRLPLALALALSLAVAAAPTLAQSMFDRAPGHGPHGERDIVERMAERLDLSDVQREQIEQIVAEHRALMDVQRDSTEQAHQRLADLLHAESFDETAVRVAAEELSALRTEQIVARARMMHTVGQTLTPEQREEMQAMQERRREAAQDRPRGPHRRPRHKHSPAGG